MLKRDLQIPTLSGVGLTGQTATATIPLGSRYHDVTYHYTLTVPDADAPGSNDLGYFLDDILQKVNGKVQRPAKAREIAALNALQNPDGSSEYSVVFLQDGVSAGGLTTYEFLLTIFYAEPWRKSLASQEGLAWGTGNLASFQHELKLVAHPTATLLTLTGVVNVDPAVVNGRPAPLGPIISKWYRTQIPINGTSQNIQSLDKLDAYQQISFFDSYITNVEILVNSVQIKNVSKQENDAELVRRGMTPVANRFDIVNITTSSNQNYCSGIAVYFGFVSQTSNEVRALGLIYGTSANTCSSGSRPYKITATRWRTP